MVFNKQPLNEVSINWSIFSNPHTDFILLVHAQLEINTIYSMIQVSIKISTLAPSARKISTSWESIKFDRILMPAKNYFFTTVKSTMNYKNCQKSEKFGATEGQRK